MPSVGEGLNVTPRDWKEETKEFVHAYAASITAQEAPVPRGTITDASRSESVDLRGQEGAREAPGGGDVMRRIVEKVRKQEAAFTRAMAEAERVAQGNADP